MIAALAYKDLLSDLKVYRSGKTRFTSAPDHTKPLDVEVLDYALRHIANVYEHGEAKDGKYTWCSIGAELLPRDSTIDVEYYGHSETDVFDEIAMPGAKYIITSSAIILANPAGVEGEYQTICDVDAEVETKSGYYLKFRIQDNMVLELPKHLMLYLLLTEGLLESLYKVPEQYIGM